MNKKGSALYFSLVILSLLIIIVFGLSSVIVVQIKNIKQSGGAVVALCAADSGAEQALYELFKNNIEIPYGPENVLLENGASFQFSITNKALDSSCTSEYYCINSIGIFRNTRRAIKITGM